MSKIPLEGIKAISFGVGIVVPELGKIIGQLGAQVIKIEYAKQPDFMRTITPDPNNSPGFNESNRNHKVFSVNLSTEKGKKMVRELVKTADIFCENYRGDVMERLGFDYESVKAINPEIIYISSQGFGKDGPYSAHKGYGPTLCAASGLLSIWGQPEDEFGCGGSFPHPDNAAGWQGTMALLAALDYKRRTGRGQFIDMSQAEVAASLIGEAQLDFTINGRIQKRIGNRNPYAAPHGCYRCKGNDQWCAISIYTNEEWESFCNVTGNSGWMDDPRFKDLASRLKNVDELDSLIEAWTADKDHIAVMHLLQGAGIAAGFTMRAYDSILDPQMNWQKNIEEMDHPVAGKRMYPATPFDMADMEFPKNTPAPVLGEHTAEICRDMLNMSDDEIMKLKEENVLYLAEEKESS